MGGVFDALVHRFVAGVELVSVAEPEPAEVELQHARDFTIAAHVEPDTDHAAGKDHGGQLGLWPEVFGIGDQ